MPTCPLVDLHKCLGPCAGAVGQDEYRAAAAEAEQLLRGTSLEVLERAIARRDELAEELRFEEAAELRDRIRDLEHLVGAQQRMQSFAERNLVVVARDTASSSVRLFMVRAGRLVRELSVPLPARKPFLRKLLQEVYVDMQASPVSRDEVDEMVILDTWLKHHREKAHEIPVLTDALDEVLPQIMAALAEHATAAKSAAKPVPATRRAHP
jgi:excinuclease UvrABC nuclease subunit